MQLTFKSILHITTKHEGIAPFEYYVLNSNIGRCYAMFNYGQHVSTKVRASFS